MAAQPEKRGITVSLLKVFPGIKCQIAGLVVYPALAPTIKNAMSFKSLRLPKSGARPKLLQSNPYVKGEPQGPAYRGPPPYKQLIVREINLSPRLTMTRSL